MVRDYWKEYWEQRKYLLKARRKLVAAKENADQLVAEALWRLNREVKVRGEIAGNIYGMKNQLVKIFYQKGYCIKAVTAEQTLECWHTRRYNEGWDDYCPKCSNTGVYARHLLYHFTFLIGGQRYIWHQPERLVNWKVELTGEPMVYEGKDPEVIVAGADLREDEALLWMYLKRAGVNDLPKLRTVKEMTGHYWWLLKHKIWMSWYHYWRQVQRQVRGKPGPVARLIERLADDGIPF